jgi:DNA polymerase-3 subunit delta
MYRAKLASQSVINARDPANYFNYKNKEFRLANASRDGAKYTIEQLRTALDELDEADCKLKSTSVDPKIVLEELVLGLLRI